MSARIGKGLGGLLVAVSAGVGQSQWTLVAPRSNTLPNGEPPASFDRRNNIISPKGVSSGLDARPALLHTNKFYSHILLDSSFRAAWTLPYIVVVNEEHPYGLYVSHPRFLEGERQEDRLKWYAATLAKDVILSAEELHWNQEVAVTDFDDEGFSATVKLTSRNAQSGSMTTHLVRGMAYATAVYDNYTPEVATQHAIIRVNGNSASKGVHTNGRGRFMLELNDGSTWIVYSSNKQLELSYTPASSGKPSMLVLSEIVLQGNFPTKLGSSMLLVDPTRLKAKLRMTGTLRATRVPYDSGSPDYDEAMDTLDEHAGCYPIRGDLRAYMHNTLTNRGKYTVTWTTGGDESGLLHYALPHQLELLTPQLVSRTGLFLRSPTKGNMELVKGKRWEIKENDLPEFEWVPSVSEITSDVERGWIEYHLEKEIPVPLDNVAGSSVYFGGKNLMAYAQLCLVAREMGRNDLVEPCMDQVEAGFDKYLKHSNGNPLVYDKTWGGVIGGLGLQEGQGNADFYASYYNDHHFHYSYVINAAAVLAHLRPSWATRDNIAWVNTLIRDVNGPNKYDPCFPQFRSFDWFSGHSWAKGLLFSIDGKDQESTSEDVNFFYAMTMWAIATGNTALEGLGRLQTGVVKRSINNYFLLKDGNTNHPADFVKNKVTGIFFESKVDYTTWFGANVEYIHGIQNIPVTAITGYVRDPEFVSQEWDQRLRSVVERAEGTWNTVLYMSYATIQKHLAFKKMLTSGSDDGLLRAWALYWAASRPDCPKFCHHSQTSLDAAPNSTPTPAAPTPVPPTTPPASSPWAAPASSAYGGVPAIIPGVIQAERFDHGGDGVGYFDTSPGNNGGAFRPDEDVDIVTTRNDFYVAWIRTGEFLRYTVNVERAAPAYDFKFNVAAHPKFGDQGSFRVVTGGRGCGDYTIDLSGLVTVPPTGGWENFVSLPVSGGGNGGLSVGRATVWLCVISSHFNIHSFAMEAAFAPTPSPSTGGGGSGAFGGKPAVIPGTIQMENFDLGGEGVAYSDADPGNNGGAYRTSEAVDISVTGNQQGFNVGWTRPGEFLRYTVNVTRSVAAFKFSFRVAAPPAFADSGSFRIVTGGTGCNNYRTDLSGLVTVPSTGGWGSFADLTTSNAGTGGLSAGPATIWFCVVTAGFNIDSFTMTAAEYHRQ